MEHNGELVQNHINDIATLKGSMKTAFSRLDTVDETLEKHEQRIHDLSCSDATNKQAISELCHKIDDLVGTLKWFIGLAVTLILGIAGLAVSVFVK